MEKQRIPADFLIGTSSSAWQIEGCAGKKEGQESWAELFYDTNPDIWYDDVGPKKASDFYHHWNEDIDLMKELGMKTYRFSISWARIIPAAEAYEMITKNPNHERYIGVLLKYDEENKEKWNGTSYITGTLGYSSNII